MELNNSSKAKRAFTRVSRWVKFSANYIDERLHGLDFSMVYVGAVQREVQEFHGYSMTDAGAMRRMLKALPVKPETASFLDVGCGKGMCVRCASECGFKSVSGLDLDEHLLSIAERNMKKLGISAEFIKANATEFDGYADYDVFYFYNPFGRSVFESAIRSIVESRSARNRDIWVIYYHPVFGKLFDDAGFQLRNTLHDKTRDTLTNYYFYPKSDS